MGKHEVRARNLKKLRLLGTHIRELRKGKNLTIEQLADVAGVSENTISTLETGKLNPSVATCFDIAKALGIAPKDLFDF